MRLLLRPWCWLFYHRWEHVETLEASWEAFHDVWACGRCGLRNEGRLTLDDLR